MTIWRIRTQGGVGSTYRRALRELELGVWDVVAPPHCAACGARAVGELCRGCQAELERLDDQPRCGRCGLRTLPGLPCRADHGPWVGLSWLRCSFAYRGTGGRLVRRWKFSRDRSALGFLVRSMRETLRNHELRRPLFVSVPMWRAKRRRRGFDPAAGLADALADGSGRFGERVLTRTRDTMPQGDVRVTSRDRNVAGAFAVQRPRAVVGQDIVLVDDVVTSGATARECARVLRAAGTRQVVLLTAARSKA